MGSVLPDQMQEKRPTSKLGRVYFETDYSLRPCCDEYLSDHTANL